MHPSITLAVILLLTHAVCVSKAQSLPVSEPIYAVSVSNELVYGLGTVNEPTAGEKALLLDLYSPVIDDVDHGLRPVVLIIHGGGFEGGSKKQGVLVAMANDLAARGHVVASIDYRLKPDNPVPSARMNPLLQELPVGLTTNAVVAAVDDTLSAIEWMQSQATELSIDPDRMGLIGGSAGAFTAIHLAYALDDYGISTPELSYVVDFWGGSLFPPEDLAEAVRLLETGEPALFAVHGSDDATVPFEQAVFLVNQAIQQHVPVEFYPFYGAGHSFNEIDIFSERLPGGQLLADRMYDWIREQVIFNLSDDISGGWVNSNTLGEGIMLDYEPTPGTIFGAWFTYTADPVVPDSSSNSIIGSAGQRWLTFLLDVDGNIGAGVLYSSQGGAFDSPPQTQEANLAVGTVTIEWQACDQAVLHYTFDQSNLTGSIDIEPTEKILLGETYSCP